MASRRKVGPWTVTDEGVAYENPWIRVDHHRVIHPDGSPGIYGVVRFANVAVGVLPVFADGTVPLVGQYRFALDAYSWELPEGGGPIHTAPLEAAKRELAEETGYTAAHWAPLIEMDVSNSVTDERAACFLAWGLAPGIAEPEASEAFSHDRIPFDDLVARCLAGDIRDSLTVAMALAAETRRARGDLPAALRDILGNSTG